ncbi:MAG TPA: DNA mismatch endonuclease Vsr [Kiritimatiellia bacterium]|nr:DNA mismatch endonuclease Vsr [Kiritimatiellia bacterium]HMO99561.1 DNA mismatch endonuclease Vsr [Kiritimatiellia bacterium]
MVDVFSSRKRSEIMSRVRSSGSIPEKTVARCIRRLGFFPKLNVKHLPGTPDICLPEIRKIIFVHSCFFHQHPGCRGSERPKTRRAYWTKKLDSNIRRDQRVRRQLNRMGWSVAVVWECQLKDHDRLRRRLKTFLRFQRK